MSKILLDISDICIPKNYLPNPLGQTAEKINKEYASCIGFLQLVKEKKFYAGSSIGKFAYPTASLERLTVCCHLVEWLFYIDDQFDENIELATDQSNVVELVENYISLFCKGLTKQVNDPIIEFSVSLRTRLLELGNADWFKRICISIEEYLRIGVLGAVEVWRSKMPYTLEKYMHNREYDSGVYACIDMIEIAEDIYLNTEIKSNEAIQKMRKLTARHVAFANDIYSYNKEVPQYGNPNNLVYLLMYWKKLSFEAAVSEIVGILNDDMKNFIQLKAEICSHYDSIPLQKYILGMEYWMSGNISWSMQTSRYKIGEKVFVNQ